MSRRVLAVSSGGGHWIQLLRATSALDVSKVVFVTTEREVAVPNGGELELVPDANKRTHWRLVLLILATVALLVRRRPKVVISTGAAPGALSVVIGKMLGARTIWIDSLANTKRLSLSGRIVAPFCDVRLSQWPDVATLEKCGYRGSIL